MADQRGVLAIKKKRHVVAESQVFLTQCTDCRSFNTVAFKDDNTIRWCNNCSWTYDVPGRDVANQLRQVAAEEIEAAKRSDRITQADLDTMVGGEM